MRKTVYLAGIVVIILAGLALRPASADAPVLDADTMRTALHTTPQEEQGFIDRALVLVKNGTLPLSLVDSTFQWARKKPKLRFQHFKQALIVRAADIGITLQ
jgi:hypothetical protein